MTEPVDPISALAATDAERLISQYEEDYERGEADQLAAINEQAVSRRGDGRQIDAATKVIWRLLDEAQGDWVPFGQVVAETYGHEPQPVSSRKNWLVRKAAARLAWPRDYGIEERPSIRIRLHDTEIYDSIQEIGYEDYETAN